MLFQQLANTQTQTTGSAEAATVQGGQVRVQRQRTHLSALAGILGRAPQQQLLEGGAVLSRQLSVAGQQPAELQQEERGRIKMAQWSGWPGPCHPHWSWLAPAPGGKRSQLQLPTCRDTVLIDRQLRDPASSSRSTSCCRGAPAACSSRLRLGVQAGGATCRAVWLQAQHRSGVGGT